MHCDMLKIQDGVAIVEKLNYAIPKECIRLCKAFLIFVWLYYTETQSNILIIVLLLQSELENDTSTPAGPGPSVHGPTLNELRFISKV